MDFHAQSVNALFSVGEHIKTQIGYINNFPDEEIGAFASGTGFSGVFTAFFYLVLTALSLEKYQVKYKYNDFKDFLFGDPVSCVLLFYFLMA